MEQRAHTPPGYVYRFDRFTLDMVRGALLAAGGTEIALRPKAMAMLRQMVENAGRLINRNEIMAAIWPGVVVTDDSLTQVVKEIRRALGDDEQRLLRTVPRRGFLFAAEVSRIDNQATLVVLPSAPDLQAEPAEKPPAAAPRSMLVVLPFANMTGDPGQDYFADGITDDVTMALSTLRWFSVIARNSAFTYKGHAVDVRKVGRELGVQYVLEGSVRKAANRVRITAQLCEAEAGAQVWAGRFDGELADIFDLQDQLTGAVVGAIEPSLRQAEVARSRAKPTENLTAYDLYLRALPHLFVTRAGSDEALRLLRQAIALDPGYSAAKGTLAGLHCLRFNSGWTEPGDVAEAVRLAREVIDDAGENAPSALAWAGHAVGFFAKDHEVGAAAVERALKLAPNSAFVLFRASWIRIYAGDGEGAALLVDRAIRLSPVDPLMFSFITAQGYANFVMRSYEAAAQLSRRALHDRPAFMMAHWLLVASLAQHGDRAAAEKAAGDLLALEPDHTVAIARQRTAVRDPALFEGLRKAGLPD